MLETSYNVAIHVEGGLVDRDELTDVIYQQASIKLSPTTGLKLEKVHISGRVATVIYDVEMTFSREEGDFPTSAELEDLLFYQKKISIDPAKNTRITEVHCDNAPKTEDH